MFREKKIARLAFRAHKELLLAIEGEAKKQNTTMSQVMVEILSERLLLPLLTKNDQYEKMDPLDRIDLIFASLESKSSDDSHKLIENRRSQSFWCQTHTENQILTRATESGVRWRC